MSGYLHFGDGFGIVYSMEKKVLNFIQKYHMLQKEDKVIAGISGGADSICLLFVLLRLQEKIGFDVIAVHVNHGLRGENAKRDERFTETFCRERNVPCIVYHENVKEIAAQKKLSVEEAGRLVRRKAFEEVRIRYGGTKIALAHHQNDNAETMLLNLARGTGIRGLSGIRPVNGYMIRPLLGIHRKEIEYYLKEHQLSYCEDETNAGDEYTRNRIRHQILPMLEEQVNRQAVRHMNETMEQLNQIRDYLEREIEAHCRCVVRQEEEGLLLLWDEWMQCDPVIQNGIIQKCLENLAGTGKDLVSVHVAAVAELFEKQSGRKRNLPYNICAERNYEGILLIKQTAERQTECREELIIPGITRLKDRNLRICCTIWEKDKNFSIEQIPQTPYTKWFDYDIIKNSLTVRTRQPEDVLGVNRQGGTQKLKSYFINEKIPAKSREQILLIAEGHQILWVVGYRMSSRYQISEHTKRIIEIKIMEDKKHGRDN